NRGSEVPEYLAKVNNNYNNLLELPILFYALTALLLITVNVEPAQVILAWIFTGSRLVHTYIHTTYNNVRHRLRAFSLGAGALLAMWGLFFVRALSA
ncbi:MAG: MAPEG family protein, partial [Gammaproteobacteria bacterium]